MKNKFSISFAITVCNEHEELRRLLTQLNSFVKSTDEIVILADEQKLTNEVIDVCYEFKIELHKYPLNNNFSEFKNYLKSKCRGDYIFQIDADEQLGSFLLLIHDIIDEQPETELFYFSRINTVENIPQEYIEKWGWKKYPELYNGNHILNWPDLQARLFKNLKRIKWKNKVHEKVIGFKNMSLISDGTNDITNNRKFSLIHEKAFDRQLKQNNFYDSIV